MAKPVTLVNVPNVNTNFRPCDGNWKLKAFKMKVSTAMVQGAAIMPETSGADVTGYYTLMGVENAGGDDFVGILAEAIVSTDADYATAGKTKLVRVPLSPNSECEFTVGAGTFTAVDVGKTVEVHSDSKSLAVDTVGKGARITGYINSTRGKCAFCMPNSETA